MTLVQPLRSYRQDLYIRADAQIDGLRAGEHIAHVGLAGQHDADDDDALGSAIVRVFPHHLEHVLRDLAPPRGRAKLAGEGCEFILDAASSASTLSNLRPTPPGAATGVDGFEPSASLIPEPDDGPMPAWAPLAILGAALSMWAVIILAARAVFL